MTTATTTARRRTARRRTTRRGDRLLRRVLSTGFVAGDVGAWSVGSGGFLQGCISAMGSWSTAWSRFVASRACAVRWFKCVLLP
jgi:hypothetical protein